MTSHCKQPLAPPSCRVFTPEVLAAAIVDHLAPETKAQVLEPSYGEGVFVKAAIDYGVRPSDISAVDLKRRKKRILADGVHVFDGCDFLTYAILEKESFDYIIGNPPYFSLRGEHSGWRNSRAVVELGLNANAHSNMWQLFCEASIHCIRKGGSIAYLLPAAYENADYASSLRELINSKFQSVLIIRSQVPLCDDARDGVIILVAKGYRSAGRKKKTRLIVEGLSEACSALRGDNVGVEANSSFWPVVNTTDDHSANSLGEFLQVRIGAVTGDARYFLLTESERSRLSLPETACLRCVSKASQLSFPEIDDKVWEGLNASDARVWMFRPEGKRVLSHLAVKRYLSYDREDGGCNREAYKVKNREPWYQTILPKCPDAFVSGMNGLFTLTFNAAEDLTFSNTLYGIYFDDNLSEQQRYWIAIWLCSSAARNELSRITRVYPDGLKKIEPGDIESLRIPSFPEEKADARNVYFTVFDRLSGGNVEGAVALADRFLDS